MSVRRIVGWRVMLAIMRRFRSARMRDLRLWFGLTLIVVSMIAGARILSTGEDRMQVWQVTRDLQAGAVPSDLVPVWVTQDAAHAAYVSASSPVSGTLRWPVAAGQLLPASAITAESGPDARALAVPVEAFRLPHLQSGDRVDVWTTDTQERTPSRLVISNVLVSDVSTDASGVGSDVTVLLQVPVDRVGDVVAAARTGAVDLASVPISSWSS
jgi:hypothetical protein